jgi:uncharacterized membrane protein
MNKLRQLWIKLRSSFWFIPSLMVALSITLAVVLIETDSASSDRWLSQWQRLFGVGPEGARQMLSTLAGSMMSVMGITFSMTLVALALTSSQYTSRILWNFMRSRVTQIALGGFSAIFAYCLVVLRTIRGGNGSVEFVPDLAVIFAFILAILSIGVLVFFIHHIATSIQASSIIALIADETTTTIDRFFPEKQGNGLDEVEEDENEQHLPARDTRSWYAVPAKMSGYIQNVDYAALLNLARDNNTIVRMEHGIGAFVVQNATLVSLALTYPPDQATINTFNAPYNIGRHRTVERDPSYGIREIVDMALKALSPGVNDTSTAIMCVDYLTAILARLSCQQFPTAYRYQGETLRMIARVPTFEALLAEAFDQIRSSADGNLGIMARMLDALETLSTLTTSPCRRQALYEQVQWIAELAERTIEATHDRAQIEKRLTRANAALAIEPALCAVKKKGVV